MIKVQSAAQSALRSAPGTLKRQRRGRGLQFRSGPLGLFLFKDEKLALYPSLKPQSRRILD